MRGAAHAPRAGDRLRHAAVVVALVHVRLSGGAGAPRSDDVQRDHRAHGTQVFLGPIVEFAGMPNGGPSCVFDFRDETYVPACGPLQCVFGFDLLLAEPDPDPDGDRRAERRRTGLRRLRRHLEPRSGRQRRRRLRRLPDRAPRPAARLRRRRPWHACDPKDATLRIERARVWAPLPAAGTGRPRGRIEVRGVVPLVNESERFEVADGLAIEVRDGHRLDESFTFSPGECRTRSSGAVCCRAGVGGSASFDLRPLQRSRGRELAFACGCAGSRSSGRSRRRSSWCSPIVPANARGGSTGSARSRPAPWPSTVDSNRCVTEHAAACVRPSNLLRRPRPFSTGSACCSR